MQLKIHRGKQIQLLSPHTMQQTNKCHLATIAFWKSLKATIAKWHYLFIACLENSWSSFALSIQNSIPIVPLKNEHILQSKKKTYGRNWICRPMRIVAPIQVCISNERYFFLLLILKKKIIKKKIIIIYWEKEEVARFWNIKTKALFYHQVCIFI